MAEGHSQNILEDVAKFEESDSQQGRQKNLEETYKIKGGKLSFHGVAYQRKLLMLFALRSIDKYPNFSLATEMEKADRLDDVILRYPRKEGTGNIYRFLQSKHRRETAKNIKRISATDLLRESNDDFSIPNYFRAYLNIVNDCEFLSERDEIHDVILCSNAGLWLGTRFGDFELRKDIFEGSDYADAIFGNTLMKFKTKFPGRKKLVCSLMNSFSKFPEAFAKSVVSGNSYEHQSAKDQKLMTRSENIYEIVFQEEVVDLQANQFREPFVKGLNLSNTGKHFRDVIVSLRDGCHENSEFQNWLRSRTLDIKGISADLGVKAKSVAKKLSESVRKNQGKQFISVKDNDSVITQNIEKLILLNVLEIREGCLNFSRKFLDSVDLTQVAKNIRSQLIKNLSYFNMDEKTLERVRFRWDHKKIQERYLTVAEFNPEKIVEQFLSKLTFALDHPNEEMLENLIKDDLKSFLNLSDVENQYSIFDRWIDNWLTSPKGKYLTENHITKFLCDLKDEIIFDLRLPVSNFIGRSKELTDIEKTLFATEEGIAIISQTASVSGLGGIGKSELARMFAKKYEKNFNNIIWIDSQSQDSIESSFRRLAFDRLNLSSKNPNGEDKSIESIVEEVYQRLRGKRNLIVLDNAVQLRDDGEGNTGIQRFMTQFKEKCNYYIITSRNQNWDKINVFSLNNFTEDEAVEFFKISFGPSVEFDCVKYHILAKTLGNFPLALQHAVAYIKETSQQLSVLNKRFTVSDYLVKFQEKSKELLNHKFPKDCEDHYTKTTYTTMRIAIESLSSKDHGTLSVKILNVISYLHPDRIETSLLTRILSKEDEITVSRALLLLQQYSLISLQGDTVSIHRLLQLVIRINLKENNLEEENLKVILQSWDYIHIGHRITVWSYSPQYANLMKTYASLPLDIIVSFFMTNQVGLAILYLLTLKDCYTKVFGDNHPNTAKCHSLIGTALALQDERKEGTVYLQSTFEEQRKFFGDSHPVTLISKQALASINNRSCDTLDCVDIFRDVYLQCKATFGDNSLFASTIKVELANSLYTKFHFREAQKLFQEIIEQHKETHSSDAGSIVLHAEVMICVIKLLLNENYAENYKLLGTILEEILAKTDIVLLRNLLLIVTWDFLHVSAGVIVNTFRRYYPRFKEQYGDENLELTEWRLYYAYYLTLTGSFEEGLTLLLEVYHKQRSSFDEKDFLFLRTSSFIASAFCYKCNHREALRLHKDNLCLLEKNFPKDYVNILKTKMAMAKELYHLGEVNHALVIMGEIFNSKNTVISGRLYFREAALYYAIMLRTAEQFDKANMEFSEIMRLQNERFGEKNISTLTVSLQYSISLYESGDRKKSLEILNKTLRHLYEIDTKANTIEMLSLKELAAHALDNFGMYEQEKCFRLKALNIREKLYGKKMSRTLLNMCKLAIVECELGNFHAARELLKDIEGNLVTEEICDDFVEVHLNIVNVNLRLNDFKECLNRMKKIQETQVDGGNAIQNKITNTMINISVAMGNSGQFDESLKILSKISSKQISDLGSDNRKTLFTLRHIALVLFQKKDYENALKQCKRILDVQNRIYGEEDIDTIRTKVLLSNILSFVGQHFEALDSLKHCHILMCEKLGEDDKETLEVKYLVGCNLCNFGGIEEGKRYLFEVYKKQKTLFGEKYYQTAATKLALENVIRNQSNPK